MSDKAYVSKLPWCDICNTYGVSVVARYDARTLMGPWANLCNKHFMSHTLQKLGIGYGQELIVKDDK